MNHTPDTRAGVLLVLSLLAAACQPEPLAPGPSSPADRLPRASAVASQYAADFVATAATGYDLNAAGDVVGRAYQDPGCGPFCLPPQDIVAWRNGTRIVLPPVPGFAASYQWPQFINDQGLIAGVGGIPGSSTHAAVWTPSGAGYTVQDLGVFPGTSSAEVAGLDEQGRIVGWATQGGAIPTLTVPYLWSAAGGMVNLAAQGFPMDRPMALSPGGMVATTGYTYQLGNPASTAALPPPPAGFFPPGNNVAVVNDAGDQARFLVTTSSQSLAYPFRLSRGGTWQALSPAGTGHLTRFGLGSINGAQDVSLTVQSTGLIAAGPAGPGQSLSALLSPAYPGATVTDAGPMNAAGQVLAQVMIGRSPRLMKLTPATGCGSNCLVASSLVLAGQFVQDPAFPGSCFQGGKMYNVATATVTITSEAGVPLANAQVRGRFLDDYWTDKPVTGTTDAAGVVRWSMQGPCGVGAIAFLVEGASLGSRSFDRTRGVLSNWVIPSTTPVNQPPVASFTVSCTTTRACTFNGGGSTDDHGITAYAWNFGDGTSGSGATAAHTYAAAGTYTVTLTVTDAAGLTGVQSRSVAVGTTTNLPPVASWTVSCQPAPAHTCSFDATASRDPDGSIVAHKWTNSGGVTVATQASFTRTFSRSMTLTWTLTVTDNGGRTATRRKTFTVP